MSARAVAAVQLNRQHHPSKGVPCHPVLPRLVACSHGTSTVLCRRHVNSELRSLFPKAIIGASKSHLFRFVEDALVVSFLGMQEVEDDASKFVGCGCDCLGL